MRYEFRLNDKHFEVLSKRMYIHKDLKSYEKNRGRYVAPPPLYITYPRGLALRYYRMNRNILFLEYDLDSKINKEHIF